MVYLKRLEPGRTTVQWLGGVRGITFRNECFRAEILWLNWLEMIMMMMQHMSFFSVSVNLSVYLCAFRCQQKWVIRPVQTGDTGIKMGTIDIIETLVMTGVFNNLTRTLHCPIPISYPWTHIKICHRLPNSNQACVRLTDPRPLDHRTTPERQTHLPNMCVKSHECSMRAPNAHTSAPGEVSESLVYTSNVWKKKNQNQSISHRIYCELPHFLFPSSINTAPTSSLLCTRPVLSRYRLQQCNMTHSS